MTAGGDQSDSVVNEDSFCILKDFSGSVGSRVIRKCIQYDLCGFNESNIPIIVHMHSHQCLIESLLGMKDHLVLIVHIEYSHLGYLLHNTIFQKSRIDDKRVFMRIKKMKKMY